MTAMLTYRAPRSRTTATDDPPRSIASIVETERAEHAELGLFPLFPALRPTLPRYDVENYLRYQGRKFAARLDPNCYVALTHTLDTHDVARGRAKKNEDYRATLASLPHECLVVGITSDALYPFHLQMELAQHMPNARMYTIDSKHGHDAFLIDIANLNAAAVAARAGRQPLHVVDGTTYGTASDAVAEPRETRCVWTLVTVRKNKTNPGSS